MFKKYEANEIGNDYVCGDIHGCFSMLEEKLESVGFDKDTDRLFSVGDLTDRGEENERALDFLNYEWFIPCLGNHEEMILMCYDRREENWSWHVRNGGGWWNATSMEFRREYIKAIKKLPLVIQVGNFGILHSTVPRDLSWDEFISDLPTHKDHVLWERDLDLDRPWVDGISGIFAGHSIVTNPTPYGNIVDIDTGAFLHGEKWNGRDGRITVVRMGHDE